jgi:SAM-dependent methyltransferase
MEPISKNVFELEETIKSWDSDYYHPIAEKYYDQAISTMLRLMEVKQGARVLDAGCGPGVHTIRVAKENHQVFAIDISKKMLEEANVRVKQSGMSHLVEFQEEDLTNLSFPDASFHYVFSWGVIIHIPEIEKALDQLARIVAPGGKLALYVSNQNALDHKIESVARFMLRKPLSGRQNLPLGKGVWYDMHGEKLWLWLFNITALTHYLEERGFQRKHHILGEFTEIQRRVKGFPKTLLLRFNNLCYGMKVNPNLAYSNLLVFEKTT